MDINSKKQTIRKQIRSSYIKSIKDKKRRELQIINEHDYDLLKNINLTSAIDLFKKYFNSPQDAQQPLNQIFLYATSRQSDHLFFLFDDVILQKLELTLHSSNFSHQKKALWILNNYIFYEAVYSKTYVTGLQSFWDIDDRKVRELILNSMENITRSAQNVHKVLQGHLPFIQKIISFYMEVSIDIPQAIYLSFLQIVKNLIINLPYHQIPKKQFLFKLSSQLSLLNLCQEIKSTIMEVYRLVIMQNICNFPHILLTLKSQLKQCASSISNEVTTQKHWVKFVISGLKLLKAVFKLNIPECQQQQQFLQLFDDIFSQNVYRIFECISHSQNNKQHYSLLDMFEEICLQNRLLEQIIFDNLKIVSYMFYHAKFAEFRLKKKAILCLCNCWKVGISDYNLRQNTIEIFMNNGFVEILIDVFIAVQDSQLLEQAMEALHALLAQRNQLNRAKQFDQQLNNQYKSNVYQYVIELANHKADKIKELSCQLANQLFILKQEI